MTVALTTAHHLFHPPPPRPCTTTIRPQVQFDRDWHVRQQRPGAHNWDQLLAVVVPGKKHPGGSENENMGIKLQLQIRPPFNVLNGRNGTCRPNARNSTTPLPLSCRFAE